MSQFPHFEKIIQILVDANRSPHAILNKACHYYCRIGRRPLLWSHCMSFFRLVVDSAGHQLYISSSTQHTCRRRGITKITWDKVYNIIRICLTLAGGQVQLYLRVGDSWWNGLVVRRAGLLWSQRDFEWRWSVPLFKCLTVLEFSFILFDLCLLITFFNFIMNYVPIVTFWIFTYHKIWILSIMFCSIWSYWIIYFLACLEVSWRVVS